MPHNKERCLFGPRFREPDARMTNDEAAILGPERPELFGALGKLGSGGSYLPETASGQQMLHR
jgi:hypothetical protein